jgi:hypothetical protein
MQQLTKSRMRMMVKGLLFREEVFKFMALIEF